MHTQHGGLSQTTAEQHITQRQEQATHGWLVRGTGLLHDRRRLWMVRG